MFLKRPGSQKLLTLTVKCTVRKRRTLGKEVRQVLISQESQSIWRTAGRAGWAHDVMQQEFSSALTLLQELDEVDRHPRVVC